MMRSTYALCQGIVVHQHLFDAQVLNLPGEVVSKDSIPVSQQITRH